jgi:hypothetical protein
MQATDVAAWTIAAAAVLSYLAARRLQRPAALVLSGIAAISVAGMGAALALRYCHPAVPSGAHSCATILTAILAFDGRRARLVGPDRRDLGTDENPLYPARDRHG